MTIPIKIEIRDATGKVVAIGTTTGTAEEVAEMLRRMADDSRISTEKGRAA